MQQLHRVPEPHRITYKILILTSIPPPPPPHPRCHSHPLCQVVLLPPTGWTHRLFHLHGGQSVQLPSLWSTEHGLTPRVLWKSQNLHFLSFNNCIILNHLNHGLGCPERHHINVLLLFCSFTVRLQTHEFLFVFTFKYSFWGHCSAHLVAVGNSSS